MPVLHAPDPRLTQPAAPVRGGDAALARRLLDTVRTLGGAGLAAPQIGVPQRVIVVLPKNGVDFLTFDDVWWNPQITLRSQEQRVEWEGCLSIPGLRGLVPRAWSVTVTFHRHNQRRVAKTFETWTPHTLKCAGWQARVVQHEIDHLDGVLFTTRATRTEPVAAATEGVR